METKNFNTNSVENNKNEMSKGAAAAASGIAGAAVGAGTATAFSTYGQSSDSTDPVDPDGADANNPTGSEEHNLDIAASPEVTKPADTEETVETVEVVEAEDTEASVEPDDMPFHDPIPQGPAQTEIDTVPVEEGEPIAQNVEVEEVVNDIIDIEEIDPNDIDGEDLLEFQEIGVLYSEDGDVFYLATFNDEHGNEFVLVDVDGDLYFDLLTDSELNPVAIVGSSVSTDDVEDELIPDTEPMEPDDITIDAIDEMDVTDDIIP